MDATQHSTLNGAASNGYPDAQTFAVSRFNKKFDSVPKASTLTRRELRELFSKWRLTNGDGDAAKDGPLLSGAIYPDGATRANENVSFASIVFLDFDGDAMRAEIEERASHLNNGKGVAGILHSTFTHDPENGAFKYRLVLFLREPIAAKDWPDFWARLSRHFGNKCDSQRKDAAGMFYLPSCPKSRESVRIWLELEGPLLDPTTLPELPAEPPRTPYTAPESQGGDNYARKAFEAEIGRLCQTTGNRNQALNDTARRLGQFIGAGRLDRSEVESALMNAARANGYAAKDGEGESRSTMKSGLDAGELEPNFNGLPQISSLGAAKLKGTAPTATAPKTEDAPRFELFTLDDLETIPRPKWLVQNILVEQTTSVISADSGSFKSFVALDIALCIATGTPFFERDVKQGTVVYVAAEGFFTLRDRATAWLMEHELARPKNFHILRVPVAIADVATVAAFAAQLEALDPAFIVLDTLSQCALGLNENSNDEMARFVAGMMQLGVRSGAHVCAVHHNSKAGGFRGASAIHANVDARISLERPENDTTNTVFVPCEKQRGKPFAPFALRGEEVVLPYPDEYGEEVTSLVFQLAGAADIPTAKHPKTQQADKTAARLLEVFDQVAVEGEKFGGVKVGFWKEAVEASEPPICEKRTFWKYRKKLENDGAICECGTHNGSALYRRSGSGASGASGASSEKCTSCSQGAKASDCRCIKCIIPLGDALDAPHNEAPEVEKPKSKKARASNGSEPYKAHQVHQDTNGLFVGADADDAEGF